MSLIPGTLNLPPWLPQAAEALIQAAEIAFPEVADEKPKARRRRGPVRKEWVKNQLKSLLRHHDITFIPDWIEGPAEDAIVDLVIEAVFSITLFGKKKSASE